LTGIKDTTLAKYLWDYQFGFEKGKLENFVGACNPYLTRRKKSDNLTNNQTKERTAQAPLRVSHDGVQ